LRNLLVIVQVALALVLLVGAALMMRSFLELRRQDPGFEPERVLTFRTGLPPAMFNGNLEIPLRFFSELLPRFRGLAGVEAVGAVSMLPGIDGDVAPYRFEGDPPAPGEDENQLARHRVATAGYFDTVRIPLLAGRFFDDTVDVPGSSLAAIVDETIAVRHFGSAAAALGKRIVNRNAGKPAASGPGQAIAEPPFIEIVGVVGGIRHRLDRPNPEPTVYMAHSQYRTNFLSVVMRTRDDPAWLLHSHAVRDAVLAVNRDIPIYNPLTLEEVLMLSETVWPRRFFGWLFAVFGVIALFLACIGIYGVMSYNVTQRVRELGIRLALGAPPRAVLGLVVRYGLRLVGWGLALGLLAALLLSNLLVGVLYRVMPQDPVTFILVPLLLVTVALVACWLPGRRAVRIDPNAALRSE
jgi:putative ABC transport system permease protein